MIDVSPLSDEVAPGHFGRFATLNRMSRAEAWAAIGGAHAHESEAAAGMEVLSSQSKLDSRQYAKMHSMIPLMGFISTDLHPATAGGWSSETVRMFGMKSPRFGAYLCPGCVQEDMGFWRYSYWRRAHQLPGAHWCERHSMPLSRIGDPDAFMHSPCFWLNCNAARPIKWSDRAKKSDSAATFVDICQAMLDRGRSHSTEHIRWPIIIRARACGLRRSARAAGVLLSDLAQERLPFEMLLELFPTFQKKTTGVAFQPIDRAVLAWEGQATAVATALALTLMFASAEEAFLWLFENSEIRAQADQECRDARQRRISPFCSDLEVAPAPSTGHHAPAAIDAGYIVPSQ